MNGRSVWLATLGTIVMVVMAGSASAMPPQCWQACSSGVSCDATCYVGWDATTCGDEGVSCGCEPWDEDFDETQELYPHYSGEACDGYMIETRRSFTKRTIHKVRHHQCPSGQSEEIVGIQDEDDECWLVLAPVRLCSGNGGGNSPGRPCY
jgi:hypothetical protein